LRGGLCALRARGLFFILVWAASGGGRWGPRGAARHNPFGEAPSALPPDDPAEFVVHPTLLRTSLKGPSMSHHSARAARPLLRELPRFARRSPCALNERVGSVSLAVGESQKLPIPVGEERIRTKLADVSASVLYGGPPASAWALAEKLHGLSVLLARQKFGANHAKPDDFFGRNRTTA
jgi:hypothetical protein